MRSIKFSSTSGLDELARSSWLGGFLRRLLDPYLCRKSDRRKDAPSGSISDRKGKGRQACAIGGGISRSPAMLSSFSGGGTLQCSGTASS
jgi:hypothetical protein